MFLEQTLKRNLALFKIAKKLHQEGKILPNTYVLDLDSVFHNAKILKAEADKCNIELYLMTKQFGRNPLLIEAVKKAGIDKIVCVDFFETLSFIKKGYTIGNVGHLVQTPSHIMKRVLKAKPIVITVFSVAKAIEVNNAAAKMNLKQDVLLRVYSDKDSFYYGQEGGFALKNLASDLKELAQLNSINLIGFTSFPTFLYDKNRKRVVKTSKIKTLKDATKIATKLGFQITHLNAPSTNCVASLKLLKKHGMTHGEPGHAIIGTMPSNVQKMEPEIPAIVYVSEVSHFHNQKAYIYGGGYYPRGKLQNGVYFDDQKIKHVKINYFDGNYIDYYLNFNVNEQTNVKVGTTILMAFRAQIFTTRAHVAVVSGLSRSEPKLLGVYTSQGEKVTWL